MSKPIEIVSVNISEKKGTTKHPVEKATLDALGIVGDAHAGPWHRQVSLLADESIESFRRLLPDLALFCLAGSPGAPGARAFLEVTALGAWLLLG